MKESQVKDLLDALGHADFYAGREDPVERVRQTDEFNALLEPIFASNTTAHWIEVLTAARVPVAPIRTLGESAADPQVAHRLSVTEIPDFREADDTATMQVVSASHITEPAPPQVQRPPPKLGEHTLEILAELGYTSDDVDAFRQEGVI